MNARTNGEGFGSRRHGQSTAILIWTLLLLSASIPLITLGADFLNYSAFFDMARAEPLAVVMAERYEPLFSLSGLALSRMLSSNASVYGLLMGLILAMKVRLIHRMTTSFAASLLLVWYAVRFLPLHELTQIRIAMALGFWLYALLVRSPRQAYLLAAMAVLSHYSTIALLPVLWAWRVVQQQPQRYLRIEWPAMLASGIAIAFLTFSLRPLLETLSLLFSILSVYSNDGFGDDRVNLLSIGILLDALLLALGWLCAPRKDAALRFWLAVLTLSLGTYFVLADFPVLAHRVREMMSICWLPYLALALARRGQARMHAQLTLLLNVPVYIYLNFFGTYALFSI